MGVSIVVDYLGPRWLESFCNQRGVKVFDRVTEIRSLVRSDLGLDANAFRQLKHLKEISLYAPAELPIESATKKLLTSIPNCRVEKVEQSEIGGIVVKFSNVQCCSSLPTPSAIDSH